MKTSIILIAGFSLFLACSKENSDANMDLKVVSDEFLGGESYGKEISGENIDQMRSMMNIIWGWQSYFPRIINCWDPSSVRVSVYDLAAFPKISYDGTLTNLAFLQLSVIPEGSYEGYSPGLIEPLPKEAAIIWDSFCAGIDRTIDKQIDNLIEEGSFWDEFDKLSSYLEERNEHPTAGNKHYESNYSLRIIQSIQITSSSDLYGVTAGEDIGSHFELSGRVDYLSHEWDTLDDQFQKIDKSLDGMSFEEFLGYRPHMRRIEIKLKDLPEENPDNLTLNVFIRYEDGDGVTASTTIKIE